MFLFYLHLTRVYKLNFFLGFPHDHDELDAAERLQIRRHVRRLKNDRTSRSISTSSCRHRPLRQLECQHCSRADGSHEAENDCPDSIRQVAIDPDDGRLQGRRSPLFAFSHPLACTWFRACLSGLCNTFFALNCLRALY
jgi:hypothetical protein